MPACRYTAYQADVSSTRTGIIAGLAGLAALRTAQALPSDGVTLVRPEFLAAPPAFNLGDDHQPLHSVVADLRREIAAAAAVLFCTPEYAGALPGSFKKLLDWTVGGGIYLNHLKQLDRATAAYGHVTGAIQRVPSSRRATRPADRPTLGEIRSPTSR